MSIHGVTFVRSIVAMVSVGMAFPGAFGWCMIIKIRFISKASCFITIFNEVRTISCMAGSKFIGFVILTCMNVVNFMA